MGGWPGVRGGGGGGYPAGRRIIKQRAGREREGGGGCMTGATRARVVAQAKTIPKKG